MDRSPLFSGLKRRGALAFPAFAVACLLLAAKPSRAGDYISVDEILASKNPLPMEATIAPRQPKWRVSSGAIWRDIGDVKFRSGSRSQQLRLPNLVGKEFRHLPGGRRPDRHHQFPRVWGRLCPRRSGHARRWLHLELGLPGRLTDPRRPARLLPPAGIPADGFSPLEAQRWLVAGRQRLRSRPIHRNRAPVPAHPDDLGRPAVQLLVYRCRPTALRLDLQPTAGQRRSQLLAHRLLQPRRSHPAPCAL